MTDSAKSDSLAAAFSEADKLKEKNKKDAIEPKKYNFDPLKMYFGEPYTIKSGDKEIVIRQPAFGEIVEVGEDIFYSTLYVFVGNPTQYRLQLWDMGIDWNKISDYELFCMSIKTTRPEICSLLFESKINFKTFDLYTKTIGDEQVLTLYSESDDLEISEEIYLEMREYFRMMFNIHPKVEKAKGKSTKQWMIDEEREKLEIEKKKKTTSSTLLSMVSFAVNHPGFKFKTKELKKIGIVQFMDSVQRLLVYEETRSLINGRYAGFADLSKIPKEQFDFMRDIHN